MLNVTLQELAASFKTEIRNDFLDRDYGSQTWTEIADSMGWIERGEVYESPCRKYIVKYSSVQGFPKDPLLKDVCVPTEFVRFKKNKILAIQPKCTQIGLRRVLDAVLWKIVQRVGSKKTAKAILGGDIFGLDLHEWNVGMHNGEAVMFDW